MAPITIIPKACSCCKGERSSRDKSSNLPLPNILYEGSEGGSGGFAAIFKGRGWRRGLGRRFARFALRAMSIKNYPHRFAKLVFWERHLCHPGRIGQPETHRPALYFLSFSIPSSSGFQPPPNALKRDTMSVSSFPLDRV